MKMTKNTLVKSTVLRSDSNKDKIEFYKARILILEDSIIQFHNQIEHTTSTIQKFREEINTLWEEENKK